MRWSSTLLFVALAACGSREVQVGIDEAHDNRHTLNGSLWVFHGVFRQAGGDGTEFRFRRTTAPFHKADLDQLDVLVVAGATRDIREEEVDAVVEWVEDGGSLWLMVDHPPLVAPSMGLADAFGFVLVDRMAGERGLPGGRMLELSGDLLTAHPIVVGPFGRVDLLVSAWGTAFPVPEGAEVVAWAPDAFMPADDAGQRFAVLATRRVGSGRVLVAGETSMFTCQEQADGSPKGFCVDDHEDGRLVVRNAAAWLDGG